MTWSYGVVVVLHSWNRWVVLLLGVVVVADQLRARRWALAAPTPGPTGVHRVFIRALDLQLVLGLLLLVVLSPWPRAAWADLGAAMGNPVLRFFTIEHAFGMLVAVGVAHLGFDRLGSLGRRAASGGAVSPDEARRAERRAVLAQLVWLVVTLVSIPWPGLAYGRPLARFGL